MEGIKDWEILNTYQVSYKEKTISIELIRIQIAGPPEYHFFVHLPDGDMLLNKIFLPIDNKILWNGTGTMTFDEKKELGETIEAQIKFILPFPETNNPFKYKGDLSIRIEEFYIQDVKVQKAKAPYSDCIYYRMEIFGIEYVIAKCTLDMTGEKIWTIETPSTIETEDFEDITAMIDNHESKKDSTAIFQ